MNEDITKLLEEIVKKYDALAKKAEQKAEQDKPREGQKVLVIGSDMDVAEHVGMDMVAAGQFVNHTEGSPFFEWRDKLWVEVEDNMDIIKRFLKPYDGAKAGRATIKMDRAKTKSILSFLAHNLAAKDFFADAKIGINLQNGFLEFIEGGCVLVPHKPEQKSQQLLPGEYHKQTSMSGDSMLSKFFNTTFKHDPEKELKIKLIQEVAGASLIGNPSAWLPERSQMFGQSWPYGWQR